MQHETKQSKHINDFKANTKALHTLMQQQQQQKRYDQKVKDLFKHRLGKFDKLIKKYSKKKKNKIKIRPIMINNPTLSTRIILLS